MPELKTYTYLTLRGHGGVAKMPYGPRIARGLIATALGVPQLSVIMRLADA